MKCPKCENSNVSIHSEYLRINFLEDPVFPLTSERRFNRFGLTCNDCGHYWSNKELDKINQDQLDIYKSYLNTCNYDIVDIADMPGYNPEVPNGTKSVTEKKVVLDGHTPNLTPHCVKHGAMNKVSKDGIWRCLTCNEGCYQIERIDSDE